MAQRDHHSLLFLQSDLGLGKGKELEAREGPEKAKEASPLLGKTELMGSHTRLLGTAGLWALSGTGLEWEAMDSEGGNVFYCFLF